MFPSRIIVTENNCGIYVTYRIDILHANYYQTSVSITRLNIYHQRVNNFLSCIQYWEALQKISLHQSQIGQRILSVKYTMYKITYPDLMYLHFLLSCFSTSVLRQPCMGSTSIVTLLCLPSAIVVFVGARKWRYPDGSTNF